jgi:hypothetical protein
VFDDDEYDPEAEEIQEMDQNFDDDEDFKWDDKEYEEDNFDY